jgi:Tfp pilus assembly protein PilF
MIWKSLRALCATPLILFLILSLAEANGWRTDCTNDPRVPWDTQIERCTAEINSGTKVGDDLSLAYIARGFAYSKKEDYDRAIADYNQAVQVFPTSFSPYYFRANAYVAKLDYVRAIADYDHVIKIAPKKAGAHTDRGHAYYLKGDYDRAIADYDRAISLHPDDAEAYYGRALVYGIKGDHDRARFNTYYSRALEKKWLGDDAGAEADFAKATPPSLLATIVQRIRRAFSIGPSQPRERTGSAEWSDVRENRPWHVFLWVEWFKPGRIIKFNECQGTIIRPGWVLTAAHCVFNDQAKLATAVIISAGNVDRTKGIEIKSKQILVHEEYDVLTFKNDIALVQIESEYGESATIGLATEKWEADFVRTAGKVVVSGWGPATILKEITVPMVDHNSCIEAWSNKPAEKPVTETNLCAVAKCIEQGMSGGPLLAHVPGAKQGYVQIGIVSTAVNNCVRPQGPDVYMRVTPYRDWIEKKIGKKFE